MAYMTAQERTRLITELRGEGSEDALEEANRLAAEADDQDDAARAADSEG